MSVPLRVVFTPPLNFHAFFPDNSYVLISSIAPSPIPAARAHRRLAERPATGRGTVGGVQNGASARTCVAWNWSPHRLDKNGPTCRRRGLQ